MTIGGTAEKILSAFHLVRSEHTTEDEEMNKCKSAVNRVKKLEKDVRMVLKKGRLVFGQVTSSMEARKYLLSIVKVNT